MQLFTTCLLPRDKDDAKEKQKQRQQNLLNSICQSEVACSGTHASSTISETSAEENEKADPAIKRGERRDKVVMGETFVTEMKDSMIRKSGE